MEREVRYCTTEGGVRIASPLLVRVRRTIKGARPLVGFRTTGPFSAFLEALAARHECLYAHLIRSKRE